MTRSSLLRKVAAPLAGVVAVSGLMLAGAQTASAAQLGSLTFNGLTAQDVAFTMTTSDACPAEATNFQIKLEGGNIPSPSSSPNLTGNTSGGTITGGINSGPFTAGSAKTLLTFASGNGLPSLGDGSYTVTLFCRTVASSASLGDFVGTFTISNGGATVTPEIPVVKANTSTALTVASSSGWGQQLSLSATVTNSVDAAVKPTGTVDFKDGSAVIASAAVSSAGVATASYGLLALGDHTITAVYNPGAGALFNASTSDPSTVSVSLAAPTLISAASLSGAVRVGGTVVCLPGIWSGATQYKYEFLKDNVVVQTSTTDADIALTSADVNKTLSCRVTGQNPVGDGTPSTTVGAKVGLGLAAVATTKPRIVYSGTPVVGKTFTASKGVWSPSATYTYYYIWKRGTTIVKQGTTATSYRASSLDKGKKITLTVQARRTGYATGTATSASVTVK